MLGVTEMAILGSSDFSYLPNSQPKKNPNNVTLT